MPSSGAEVRKTSENILAACCRAAAKIYNSPSLATLKGPEARENKYVARISTHLVFQDFQRESVLCYVLQTEDFHQPKG